MSKTPKKRKFQIEPNSLSAVEENATRSVLRRLRNPSGAAEKPPISEPKNEEIEPPKTGVSDASESVVDHKIEDWSTTNKSVVNMLTTPENVVNMLTTNHEKSEKSDVWSTTPKTAKIVVNHKKRDWSTTNKRRSSYGNVVESFRTNDDFKQKIKVFCVENGIDKQDFYRIVVDHYFENVVDHKSESVVNMFTHDDLMIRLPWNTNALIINLYEKYNFFFNEKTKWKMKDDEVGKRFNNFDVRLVELGIIQTQSNKGFAGKINAFGYYANEIQNFIDLKMPGEALDTMLAINRQRWRQATGKEIDLTFLNEGKSA